MVKEDIHNLKGVLERNSEKYILRLFQDDQEDVRQFTNDILSQGISAGRVVKYLYSLVSINKRLNKSFRSAKSLALFKIIGLAHTLKIYQISIQKSSSICLLW